MNYYKIAGLTVAMETFGRTLDQAEPYRIEYACEPDVEIVGACAAGKKNHPEWPDDLCEYMFSGSKFYRELIRRNGMMLHASCVVVDDRAYLFTANSGTGKSTHTTLWLEMLGDRAYILNDDKPALRLEDGVWYAYGTPWSGKYDISRNVRIPVGGIAVLERSEKNEIVPYSGIGAIQDILRQVNRPKGKEYREKLLFLLDDAISSLPIWKLKCNMESEAAQIAYAAMCGKESLL